MRNVFRFVLIAASALAFARAAWAGDVVEDWASVKPPAAPEVKSVRPDAATAALLMLDFNGAEAANSGPCNATTKARCLATLPKVRALLDNARAHGVFVVYSTTGSAKPEDIRADVAPRPGEPVVKANVANKFIDTPLRDLLTEHKIKTVIVVGTASEGAVLGTGSDAAYHGLDVIVPVDGISSADLYAEQYVAWHFTHAPTLAPRSTLTRVDQIHF